jgi:hypothetical protein
MGFPWPLCIKHGNGLIRYNKEFCDLTKVIDLLSLLKKDSNLLEGTVSVEDVVTVANAASMPEI